MSDPDSADEIATAWLRERPGTPVGSIGVVTRIWQLAKVFAAQRRHTLAELGVDAATLDLLSTLRRAGPPYTLTTRQLTDRTLITAGAVSQRVTRAETTGLVRRRPAARRAVEVTLTDSGHALVERVVDDLLRREEELISGLGEARRDQLAGLLHDLVTDISDRYGLAPRSPVGYEPERGGADAAP